MNTTDQEEDLKAVRRAVVRECITQARLGRNNNELRLMGFADGCINEARQYLEADAKNAKQQKP